MSLERFCSARSLHNARFYPNHKASSISKASQAVLPLYDVDNRIAIRVFKGGRFAAVMESGSPDESGSFVKQGDRLVLVDGSNQQIHVGADGTFTCTSVEDPSLSYRFEMTGEQYALLLTIAGNI